MSLYQLYMIWSSLVCAIVVALILSRTKLGKAMRAMAGDVELAATSGIETDRTILWAVGIASALVGVAGILIAFDVDMTPTMGMQPLMMGIVAVIVGIVGQA